MDLTFSPSTLPPGLPAPSDDGACDHLLNITIPSTILPSTSGRSVDISALKGLTIIFCYPRTGAPGEHISKEWDLIPGARGCTPQACSYRDSFNQIISFGVDQIFGLSTQDTSFQLEVKERLHLPYDLLSDTDLGFVRALSLPTFEWEGKKLVKRITIAVKDGEIIRTWYPVFPSDKNAEEVVKWLKDRRNEGI